MHYFIRLHYIYIVFGQPNTRNLKYYSVFAIVLALRNCQFQTQQDNRHERLRYSVGSVYMLCGYGSTFKAYDLPTLFIYHQKLTLIYNTMALINCPECGKEISDKAVACPNCGNPINLQPQQEEEYLCCPKCGSRELHAEHKGFSGGKALAGAILTGGIGLLAGTIGSKDTQITCIKCGNKFKAGEAKVVRPNAIGEEAKILELVNTKGPLAAVKWYKDTHNCGLKEAKDAVDKARGISPTSTDTSGTGCSIIILIGIGLTLCAFTLL